MRRLAPCALAIAMGCSSSSTSSTSSAPEDGRADAEAPKDAGGADAATRSTHAGAKALAPCATSPSSGQSIAALLTRLDGLPRPVSVACFVASLPRPLAIVATTSMTSAQPAESPKSPRIFLLLPGVAVSVVPEGDSAKVVEFGEWMTPTRTLKGELAFPRTAATPLDAPFVRVEQASGSMCGGCHREEAPHPSVAHGFVSMAFRPNSGTEVKVDALAAEHDACERAADTSERCAIYHALFDFGAARQGAFSRDVVTFP